ncbi:hypothetical protein SAMN04487777_11566 [Priestia aryabhattai B8W22]|uniref:hypothetical protein n=1 Tax=Priestia aryabhattai TaxID=412384 RepID=UPI00087E38EC|nr:hypothetical protein SAMN04487777_11566 [Priestia aryabhattai B8W22]
MKLSEIKILSDLANLPLSEERLKSLEPVLNSWIKDANNLSLKMSQEEYLMITPINVFNHPQAILKTDK